jgi:anti-sigma regulatory factor (Ser/Thr protein kinase)
MATGFGLTHLSEVRRAIADVAHGCGLERDDVDQFVLAANEIVANVIAHGGGYGQVKVWSDDDRIHCQVADNGPGLPTGYEAPPQPPPPSAPGGRGLWLASQLSQLEIRTGCHGTTVNLSAPLPTESTTRP